MKTVVIAIAVITMAGCGVQRRNEIYQEHLALTRMNCDAGQPSACIELQNNYAQQRDAQTAYLNNASAIQAARCEAGGSRQSVLSYAINCF